MTLFLLAAYALALVVFKGLPSNDTMSFALASATLFASGPLFARAERQAEQMSVISLAVVIVGIVMPMACAATPPRRPRSTCA